MTFCLVSQNRTLTSTPNLTCRKIYGFNPIIESKYAFMEHSTHNSFLNISCSELQLRILLTEKYMGLIPLLNRMLKKNRTFSSTTNREYAKIRKLQLQILLMQKFMSLIPLSNQMVRKNRTPTSTTNREYANHAIFTRIIT